MFFRHFDHVSALGKERKIAIKGKEYRITVGAECLPAPKFEWYHNGQLLPEDDNFKRDYEEEKEDNRGQKQIVTSLIIANVTESSAGGFVDLVRWRSGL